MTFNQIYVIIKAVIEINILYISNFLERQHTRYEEKIENIKAYIHIASYTPIGKYRIL